MGTFEDALAKLTDINQSALSLSEMLKRYGLDDKEVDYIRGDFDNWRARRNNKGWKTPAEVSLVWLAMRITDLLPSEEISYGL